MRARITRIAPPASRVSQRNVPSATWTRWRRPRRTSSAGGRGWAGVVVIALRSPGSGADLGDVGHRHITDGRGQRCVAELLGQALAVGAHQVGEEVLERG